MVAHKKTGNQGKRRGKYKSKKKSTTSKKPPGPKWSVADTRMFNNLVRNAKKKKDKVEANVVIQILARRIVEADRQCRTLDALEDRTGEQDRALSSAQMQLRKTLEMLGLSSREDPDYGDDF